MSALLSRLDREANSFLVPLVLHLYERAQRPLHNLPEPDDNFARLTVIDSAEDAQIVMENPNTFKKDLALVEMFGTSRFNANGEEWAVRRSITQPHYTDIGRPKNTDTISLIYEKNVNRILLNDIENIPNLLLRSAISIFNLAFDSDVDPKNLMINYARIRTLIKVQQHLSWGSHPTSDLLERIQSEVDYVLGQIELSWRNDPAFERLYDIFRDKSETLPGFRIASEYIMNAFAGSETSVTAILWSIDRLAALPEFQDNLAEMDLNSPEAEKILETFINETLRYFPPIPLVTRRISEDTELNGSKLEAGKVILISIIGLHHSTAHWNDPHIFDPTRREFAENTYNRRTFVPFLSGARVCGGMRLARIEIREALKLFLKRFRVSRTSDEISFDYGLVLRPANLLSWKLDYR